ncbi:MAG: aldehyde dehydrogenase family protein [Porticoccaceae bacterium]|jgi:succinate-semialdehyde dehydrogenase/glutarate-semialdehyde dehydrogenase|tara:strand:+ start:1584 stop:3026 length:1443 start_codon:yes stop_codon:yes gene_type:complete
MNEDALERQIKVRNPRTGQLDYQFKAASKHAIKATIDSLRENQPKWRDAGIKYRIEVIKRWQASMRLERVNIVSALQNDTGRLMLADQEFEGLQKSIDSWCSQAPTLLEPYKQAAVAMPNVEIHGETSPYQILGAISPWNFPLLLSFIDVIPALLAGCSAVIKPSEVTPRFAVPVARSIAAVEELDAVLTIMPGDGLTGQALIDSVDVVAFTGSVTTGKKVAIAAAQKFIPAYLELGGKDPAIVLEGADLDRATTAILRASIVATGQACQSLERLYVAQADHDEFIQLLTEKAMAATLTKDDPNKGIVGPLIFSRQAAVIQQHLDDALQKGAIIYCGGKIEDHRGAKWIAPTVLGNVDHSMLIMTEETFGPIMPVMAFCSPEQAVALANDTSYGLSAAVFGKDEESALSVAKQINAGGISINDAGLTSMVFETEKSAFGYSGMGPSRVGGSGLTRFLRQQSLYVNRGDVLPITVYSEQPI